MDDYIYTDGDDDYVNNNNKKFNYKTPSGYNKNYSTNISSDAPSEYNKNYSTNTPSEFSKQFALNYNNNGPILETNNKELSYTRIAFIILFFLIFIGAISYWIYVCYEVYKLENSKPKDNKVISDLIDLSHKITYTQFGFELALLSFLLAVTAYKI